MNLFTAIRTHFQQNFNTYSEPNVVTVGFAENDESNVECEGIIRYTSKHKTKNRQNHQVLIEEDTDLYAHCMQLYTQITDAISVTDDVMLESVYINELTEDIQINPTPTLTPDFYTASDADGRVFLTLQRNSVPMRKQQNLTNAIINELQTIDSEVTKTQLQTAEWLFSDTARCSLEMIRGRVSTPTPEKYIQSVYSKQDFIQTLADTPQEVETLNNQQTFDTQYVFTESKSTEWNQFTQYEPYMDEFMNMTFDTELAHKCEAEGIWFGDFADDELMTDSMRYYVHMPITDGIIGKTYNSSK